MRGFLTVPLSCLLAGCATFGSAPSPVTQHLALADQETLVADATAELVKLYPPAISPMMVADGEASESLAAKLSDALRRSGYAVVEGGRRVARDTANGAPLIFTVDNADATTLFVRIRVGEQSVSRAYTVGEGVHPLEGWSLNLTGASPELVERATRPDLPPDAGTAFASAALAPDQPPAADVAPYAPPVEAVMAPQAVGHVSMAPKRPMARQWAVELGAFRRVETARRHWRALAARYPALASARPHYKRISSGLIVVLSGPYHAVASAKRLCSGLAGSGCFVARA